MPESYKLVYFAGKGRGEISRLLFAAAGVKYEDKRITFEDWPKVKPTTPLGSLPYLEVGKEVLGQSLAIARFLAKKFDLFGKTDLDFAKINAIMDTLVDYRSEVFKVMFEKDEAKKAEGMKKLNEETQPSVLKNLQKMLEANKCKECGFSVGKSLSVADLYLYDVLEGAVTMKADALDSYPDVKACYNKVPSLPKIAKWLKERPKSEF
uniref:Glutathione S-transferase sigma 2 n=1 Tax=Mytilus galloprovincialis TaxID=29158 RepID=J7IEQ6_MYTGA|nr:glutathione S-transferase sigma 2 [Mytilus galloprovincialis]